MLQETWANSWLSRLERRYRACVSRNVTGSSPDTYLVIQWVLPFTLYYISSLSYSIKKTTMLSLSFIQYCFEFILSLNIRRFTFTWESGKNWILARLRGESKESALEAQAPGVIICGLPEKLQIITCVWNQRAICEVNKGGTPIKHLVLLFCYCGSYNFDVTVCFLNYFPWQ